MIKVTMIVEFYLKTDRFRLTGDLDPEINAGNQFYGQDLAEWIVAAMSPDPFTVIDEDWGWLVLGEGSPATEFRINGWPEGGEDGEQWWIHVETRQKVKKLGIFSTWQTMPTDQGHLERLRTALRAEGIEFWEATDAGVTRAAG